MVASAAANASFGDRSSRTHCAPLLPVAPSITLPIQVCIHVRNQGARNVCPSIGLILHRIRGTHSRPSGGSVFPAIDNYSKHRDRYSAIPVAVQSNQVSVTANIPLASFLAQLVQQSVIQVPGQHRIPVKQPHNLLGQVGTTAFLS